MGGMQQSRFTISFSRDWLMHAKTKYFVPRNEQAVALQADGIARQVCLMIFEKAAMDLAAIMGGMPRISGISIANSSKEAECAELMKASGITVAMETPSGRVIAGAFSKGKTRRI